MSTYDTWDAHVEYVDPALAPNLVSIHYVCSFLEQGIVVIFSHSYAKVIYTILQGGRDIFIRSRAKKECGICKKNKKHNKQTRKSTSYEKYYAINIWKKLVMKNLFHFKKRSKYCAWT